MKWLLVGPGEICEHHRSLIRKELESIKIEDTNAEVVT
jgi:hypothetical protein